MLTGAVHAGAPGADHVARHSDGIADIALGAGCRQGIRARRRNGRDARWPSRTTSPTSTAPSGWRPSRTYGDTIHTLIDRSGYAGPFLPGFVAREPIVDRRPAIAAGLQPKRYFQAVDHVVGNVELGKMDEWVEFYRRVMGFTNMAEFVGDDIATDYSALMSKVVADGTRKVKFPLNEPAVSRGSRRSTSTWSSTAGPAPSTSRSPPTTSSPASTPCVRPGVEFLATPDSYYDDPELRARIGAVRVPIEELKKRAILVDRDEDGYLLQIFTKPVQDRPTVFFELIERHGSLGFGKGNFKALFEAIEREQELRGNL